MLVQSQSCAIMLGDKHSKKKWVLSLSGISFFLVNTLLGTVFLVFISTVGRLGPLQKAV